MSPVAENGADPFAPAFKVGDIVKWSDKRLSYLKQYYARQSRQFYLRHPGWSYQAAALERMRVVGFKAGFVITVLLTPFGDMDCNMAGPASASPSEFCLAEDFQ